MFVKLTSFAVLFSMKVGQTVCYKFAPQSCDIYRLNIQCITQGDMLFANIFKENIQNGHFVNNFLGRSTQPPNLLKKFGRYTMLRRILLARISIPANQIQA